jgi:glucose/arabinose dehydrogenase
MALAGLKTELIAEGLLFPSALAVAPDGRLFFVEVKKGELRIVSEKVLQPRPALSVVVPRGGEHGLVGFGLDPAFSQNHYLYTFYTQAQSGDESDKPRRNRLTRWTEQDGLASGEVPVLDNLPVGKCCHTGGKLAFASWPWAIRAMPIGEMRSILRG